MKIMTKIVLRKDFSWLGQKQTDVGSGQGRYKGGMLQCY